MVGGLMTKKIMWWHNNNEDKPASPFVVKAIAINSIPKKYKVKKKTYMCEWSIFHAQQHHHDAL